jgi:3-hydroxyisobutyrate dehydrogenase-like beta-hydroxyacid dehydrogenase
LVELDIKSVLVFRAVVRNEIYFAGAKKAASPAEVASEAKTVVTMLPASAQVHEVYMGKNGLLG